MPQNSLSKRKPPPKKRNGQAEGPRFINGAILDLRSTAEFLGITEHTLRARVNRQHVPFRRWGGRLVFIKTELESFFKELPGVSSEEAVKNL